MKIACPNCATKYALNADALGTHGRKMKCAKCAHVWVEQPSDTLGSASPSLQNQPIPISDSISDVVSEPASDRVQGFPDRPQTTAAAEPVDGALPTGPEQPRADDEELWDQDLKEERAAEEARSTAKDRTIQSGDGPTTSQIRATPTKKNGLQRAATGLMTAAQSGLKSIGQFFQWARSLSFAYQMSVLTALIMPAILVAGLIAGRQFIVRQFPDLGSLYAMVGMEVNLYGLAFEDVRTVRRPEDGVAVLIVEGLVRNLTDSEKEVPRLHFILSGRNREVYTWQDDASQHPLAAGEAIGFRTVLASPPDVADELHVRFFDNDPQLNRL